MAIDIEQVAELQNGDAASLMQALLEKSGTIDPRKLAVLEMLQHQAGQTNGMPSKPGQGNGSAVRRAKRRIRFLEEKLEDALETIDMFADALGACPECFGTNSRCPECRGRGQPGAFEPDRDLYNEWIRPAVQNHQSIRADASDSNHTPAQTGRGDITGETEGG